MLDLYHPDCVLDRYQQQAPNSMYLRVGWRPEFAGYGFREILRAAKKLAAVELKEHLNYDGPFDLLPMPVEDTSFPFLAVLPEQEEDN